MISFILTQTWWEWLNYWMSQDANNWHPISWAVDDNPIVIGIHLIAGTVLALTFLFLGTGMIFQTKKQGFASNEHKWVAIFFLSFIWMCGFTFIVREITFFLPIFWIYGAVKLTTAFFAFLTMVTYAKMLPYLLTLPSIKEFSQVKADKVELQRQANLLNEHISIWTEDVGQHITILKKQQIELSKELQDKGLPVTTLEDIHDSGASSMSKAETLSSLEKMKTELEALLDNVNKEIPKNK